MPIADTYVPITTVGNGSTVDFSFNFAIIAEENLLVYLELISTGVQTLQTLGVDYTVVFNDETPGGTVTFLAAPSALYNVIRAREVPRTQEKTFTTAGGFGAVVIQAAFDKLTALVQDVLEIVGRAIKLPVGSTLDVVLPTPIDNNILAWDGTTGTIKNVDPDDLVGATGPTGPAGPAGSGSGDVLGPATNTDSYVPQWNGANTKTLKDGLAVGTAANNIMQLTAAAKAPAVDGSLLTNVTVNATNITNAAGLPGGAGVWPAASLPTIAVNKGGTGQVTAQAAIDALSAVSAATNEHVLTKDTATGNAKWKAATGATGFDYTAAATYVEYWAETGGSTAAGSYTLVYTTPALARSGTLRIVFTLSGTGGGTRFGRIYKNGSPVGTERSTGGTVTYTEDIAGWVAGDTIQFYAYQSGGSTANINAVKLSSGTSLNAPVGMFKGTGVPATDLGVQGDLYLRTDGGATTTLYVKTGVATWTAK